jgi:hypothetical protein
MVDPVPKPDTIHKQEKKKEDCKTRSHFRKRGELKWGWRADYKM